jgi:hypothetical protein
VCSDREAEANARRRRQRVLDIDKLTNKFNFGCLVISAESTPHGKQWIAHEAGTSRWVMIDKVTASLMYEKVCNENR